MTTSIMIHDIISIKIDKVIQLDQTGCYVLRIHIIAKNTALSLSLFSNDKDNLQTNK